MGLGRASAAPAVEYGQVFRCQDALFLWVSGERVTQERFTQSMRLPSLIHCSQATEDGFLLL
jgi:hypothetical protein